MRDGESVGGRMGVGLGRALQNQVANVTQRRGLCVVRGLRLAGEGESAPDYEAELVVVVGKQGRKFPWTRR